jgi:hypothetical protein
LYSFCAEASTKKATVEEASDEDERVAPSSKKKKKKKTKKKKPVSAEKPPTSPTTGTHTEEALLESPKPGSPISSPPTLSKPPVSKAASPPASPIPPLPKPPVPKAASLTSPPVLVGATTAQSGHSYWQSLSFKSDKKLKSRPDHASLFFNPETEEKGFKSNTPLPADNKSQGANTKEAKKSWFSKLRRKTNDLMHQLLKKSEKTGGMKWDDFVLVMWPKFSLVISEFIVATL